VPASEQAADGPSGGGDRISRNVGFAFATQLSTAAFTAILTIYLARALGPAAFGTFALALGISGVVQRGSDLGLQQAAARFVAERSDDSSAVLAMIGMTLRLRILTAAVIAAALFALSPLVAEAYSAPELTWPLRGIAVSLFGQSVMLFARNIFVALRRTSRGLILVSSESAVEFTASVALVLLGGGAGGAAFGRAIGYAFGALLGVFLLGRYLQRSPLVRTGPSPVSRRDFSGYAWTMLIIGGALTIFSQIDVLLIGALISTTAAGLFSAPLRLMALLENVGLALGQGVAPHMARQPGVAPDPKPLQRALRYALIVQGMFVAGVAVWATPVVELLLGSDFDESADVLRAFAPYVLMRAVSPLVSTSLNYFGEARRRIPVGVGAVVLNAALDVALLPTLGIVAGALATDLCFGIYIAVHFWLCRKLLGLPLRRTAITAARVLLAAAAMGAILALAGTASLSIAGWILGGLGGLAVYVLVLIASGEVTVEETRTARDALRSVFSRL